MTTKKLNNKKQESDKKITLSEIRSEKKKLLIYSEIMRPKFKEGLE